MKNITVEMLLKIRLAYGTGSKTGYAVYKKMTDGIAIEDKELKKLKSVSDNEITEIIDKSSQNGIAIIPINSKLYPEPLINISVPPILLFIKGKMPQFDDTPTITVVGPRKVSELGEKYAYSLAYKLSKGGFTVVSGAALGADSAALKGCIKGGGTPVAVLGCGICYDYLPENRKLRESIAEKGCLISEYPPFEPTGRFSFPVRNRILSALSQSTVVVEAGEKSGALITAKHALEQGKEIFVIPGRINDSFTKGSNALLRDGATPLLDLSDVLSFYLPKFADKINTEKIFEKKSQKNIKKISKKSISGLSKEAEILYNNIINKTFSTDDMLNTNLSADKILSALTELEMTGAIKSLPGGFYELL